MQFATFSIQFLQALDAFGRASSIIRQLKGQIKECLSSKPQTKQSSRVPNLKNPSRYLFEPLARRSSKC